MKAIKRILTTSILFASLVTFAAAQDAATDDFFSEEGLMSKPEDTSVKKDFEDTFTKEQPISFGGNFEFSMRAGAAWYRNFSDWSNGYFLSDPLKYASDEVSDKREDSDLKLNGGLFFTARPTSSLRLYGKTKFSFPFSANTVSLDSYNKFINGVVTEVPVGIAVPSIKIWELYSDFNLADTVFIRAGKQVVKWSSNQFAFFSPADIISLTPIDVTDRGAEREGPLAIKSNIPFGANNFDFYVVVPTNGALRSITDAGIASRVQVVAGQWEFGAGAAYSGNKDIQFVATASGSLWKFGLFGEALVNRTAKGFFADVKSDGSVYFSQDRSDWFFSGTAGISYSNSDIKLDNVLVQYYFNGMGYDGYDGYSNAVRASLKDSSLGGVVSPSDILSLLGGFSGRHYLAASISESFVENSKVSAGVYWIGNLSDGSGFVTPSVTFKITDELSISVGSTVSYGGNDTQFRGIKRAISDLVPESDPRKEAFANQAQGAALKIGVTMSLGTASF